MIIAFVVDDVRNDLDRVRVLAPRSAARWEEDPRVGQILRDVQLRVKVQESSSIRSPARLVGGQGGRGGPSRHHARAGGVHHGHPHRVPPRLRPHRARSDPAGGSMRRLARRSPPRSTGPHRYIVLMLAKALVVGVIVFVATRVGDVPGAAVFAVAAMLGFVRPASRVDRRPRSGRPRRRRRPSRAGGGDRRVGDGDRAPGVGLGRAPRTDRAPVDADRLGPPARRVPDRAWSCGGSVAGLCTLALWPLAVAWWDVHRGPERVSATVGPADA